MPSRTLEAEIDRLYQLPLDEFTPARNALVKQAGADRARVRALVKPAVAAWAVNQLRWRDRKTWDELTAASENARAVNRAVLAGRSGDVRAANKVHEDAVEEAFTATLSLLAEGGHPATDLTRQAIATTLRALPGDEPPGRLTRPLQPGGFEALAGLSVATGPRGANFRLKAEKDARQSKEAAKEQTRQRQAEAAAARELREAESAARREEFEKARTERESKRAAEAVERAREAVARANADLERAEADARSAAQASKAAAERSRKAQEALARSRERRT